MEDGINENASGGSGSGGDAMIVHVNCASNGNITNMDKTYADINQAMIDGKAVFAFVKQAGGMGPDDNFIVPLRGSAYDGNNEGFYGHMLYTVYPNDSGDGVNVDACSLTINSDGTGRVTRFTITSA
jgi:hypothetical protein